MANKLIVYTCVTGGYDSVSRPSALPSWADFICFGQDAPITWQAGDNTRLARYAKLNPHIVLPEGYAYSLWIDGNIDIVDPAFFAKVGEMMDDGVLFAGLHHPQRDDVYEEALRILKNGRESFGKLVKVVRFLRKEGFPGHYGLDETNVVLRRHDDPKVREFDELWWNMLRTWTNRDQMTQSYCFWKTGLEHSHFLPQGQCAQNHPWFRYTFHGKPYVKDKSLRGRLQDALRALKVFAFKQVTGLKERRSLLLSLAVCALVMGCQPSNSMVTMTKAELQDKIKGGWAGQTIGCTYGGPTEFRYCGRMIDDSIDITWPEHYLKYYFDNIPGLYDDIYMDLTFVDVFDKEGLDAPIENFAHAFANAGYPLWHANQQARYNILQGMVPPECGYWENNPHADDIDFQIEADYAGLMAPCMPNAAAYYSDAIGHIMNYGDGWYGGVYVAAMYSLAFLYDDIEAVVKEALKAIPEESKFFRCMSDVIRWHEMYPDDWKQTWELVQQHWSFDIGCPDGVFREFNIDAVINSAYIITGLLYGEGDFAKTIEVATRCGQDSDCNPASAGGILGTMLGYSNIPEFWMPNLREVEDRNFAYTDISLNRVYQMSFDQALQVIGKNGGSIGDDTVTIKCQTPEAVRFEESFPGHWPVASNRVDKPVSEVGDISFEGKGVVVSFKFDTEDYGQVSDRTSGPVAQVEVYLDGELSETVVLPADFHPRKQEMYYKYNLPSGPHTLSFKWLNPGKDNLIITSYLVYSER